MPEERKAKIAECFKPCPPCMAALKNCTAECCTHCGACCDTGIEHINDCCECLLTNACERPFGQCCYDFCETMKVCEVSEETLEKWAKCCGTSEPQTIETEPTTRSTLVSSESTAPTTETEPTRPTTIRFAEAPQIKTFKRDEIIDDPKPSTSSQQSSSHTEEQVQVLIHAAPEQHRQSFRGDRYLSEKAAFLKPPSTSGAQSGPAHNQALWDSYFNKIASRVNDSATETAPDA